MSLRNRLGVLALAALSFVFWAVIRERSRWTGTAGAPPRPVIAAVGARNARRKAAEIRKLDAEGARQAAQGARLREKGEALGGDAAERRLAQEEKNAEKTDQ